MHPKPLGKKLTRWLCLCASISAAYAMACAGFYAQYYLTYGQWPRPDGRPAATEVHFPVLGEAVFLLLMAQFVAVPLCLVLLTAVRVNKAPVRRLVRLYAWTAMGAAFVATYGGFLDWYFD